MNSQHDLRLNSLNNTRKHCWICNTDQNSNNRAEWLIACKCNCWIHRMCLENLIDKKQRGNIWIKVTCPHCGFKYVIMYPRTGLTIKIFDLVDEIVSLVSPFVAAGFIGCSLYLSSVTFGGLTVMQVLGYKEGFSLLEKSNPYQLLVTLPSIPLLLILARYIHWQEAILKILPNNNHEALNKYLTLQKTPGTKSIDFMRRICGALLLPTMSTTIGNIFFSNIQSNLQRTLLGGVVFLGLKGVSKIYYKRQKAIKKSNREIKDYNHEN